MFSDISREYKETFTIIDQNLVNTLDKQTCEIVTLKNIKFPREKLSRDAGLEHCPDELLEDDCAHPCRIEIIGEINLS